MCCKPNAIQTGTSNIKQGLYQDQEQEVQFPRLNGESPDDQRISREHI
jgi:hypothetical protein